MKAGLRMGVVSGVIDDKELRRFNAETARMAVIEYLKTTLKNVDVTILKPLPTNVNFPHLTS